MSGCERGRGAAWAARKLTTGGLPAVELPASSGDFFAEGKSSRRQPLQLAQEEHRLRGGVSAHLARGLQAGADRRPASLAEDLAAIIVIELDTAHPGRFAVGHPGDGRTDRRSNATGAATGTA